MTEAQLRYLVEVQDRDLKELQKNVKETNDVLGKGTEDASGKASKGLGQYSGAMTLAAGAVVGVGVVAAKKFVDAASDIREELSKSKQIFGSHAADIASWSETTAKSMGISRRAALEFTGTFGNMLVPMGIAPGKAAEFSKGLVKSAADMASFNNASVEETLAAIQSGLAGETEPLRRFGVFLNADRVAAEAMALGLGKVGKTTDQMREAQLKAKEGLLEVEQRQRAYTEAVKEHGKGSLEARTAQVELEKAQVALKKATEGGAGSLSAAAKAQATYSLVMKDLQASGAMGDFARTSDGLANSQRIQAAVAEDAAVSYGKALLPAMELVQSITKTLTGFLAEHTTVTKVVAGVVFGLAAAVLAVQGAQKVYSAVTAIATTATRVFGSTASTTASGGVTRLTIAQRLLNLTMLGFPLVWIAAALVAVGVGLVVLYKKSETFRDIVNAAFGAVKTYANLYLDAVRLVIRSVDAALDAVGVGLRWLRDNGGAAMSRFRDGARPAIKAVGDAVDLVSAGLAKVQEVFRWLRDNARDIANKLGPLTDILGKAGGFLKGIVGAGDVAAGFNSAIAAAQRRKAVAQAAGGTGSGGLASQTAGLLNTIRAVFGNVLVTSGFRTRAQNDAVDGAPNSDHLTGRAFDLVPASGWSAASIAHFDRIVGWLASNPLVRWIGWRGVAGHGPGDHLHVSTYDRGGILSPGWTLAHNATGRNEFVLPNSSALVDVLRAALAEAGPGRDAPLVQTGDVYVRGEDDIERIGAAVSRAYGIA